MIARKSTSMAALMAALLLTSCQTANTVEVRPANSPYLAQPSSANESWYALGKSYLKTADYGLAIDAFRKCLKEDATDVAALNGLGITYDMLRRFDLSQKYYDKALALEPRSAVTISNLAYSQHLQGEAENAVQLAALAENIVRGGGEKNADILAKVAGTNRMLAAFRPEAGADIAETQVAKVPVPQMPPARHYTVERMGARDWQLVEKAPVQDRYESVRYKASFSVGTILKRAGEKVAVPENEMPETAQFTEVLLVEEDDVRPAYRILNGTGRPRMAKRMAGFLLDQSLEVRSLGNAGHFGHDVSTIAYVPGHEEQAAAMAALLPVEVKLVEQDNLAAEVELIMGNDLLGFDTSLYQGHFDI